MKTWTAGQMIAEGPCYLRARVREIFENKTLSLLDILNLDIPDTDKIWVATRKEALPDSVRKAWLDGIVTRAVTNHALRCGVPAVENWASDWLANVDRSASYAARAADAASYAAHAADAASYAFYAASYAFHAASHAAHAADAARAADAASYVFHAFQAASHAFHAAAHAARAASDADADVDADADAASDAESSKQVADLIALLENDEEEV